ncbi:MAG TPA: four-carbon acid sugar kinase family protein [Opitutaceae bacterium]|nr:four-carbon acid sugar kinase family protein [Opitutaceae bacterium]
MIAVVADDISGAAELAGAALRHGLRAEVQTSFDPATDADVVCLDTDTRSLAASEAAPRTAEAVRRLAEARPRWIYKKCDSVLRGNVRAELLAAMGAAGKSRAMLVSANPSRRRVVRAGQIFVGDLPLHDTPFAHDPEHPRTTARIVDLLGGEIGGVDAPDAESAADLVRHAEAVDGGILPAGGVEFFEALLRKEGCKAGGPVAAGPRPSYAVTLAVCGSATSWAVRRDQAGALGMTVFAFPLEASAIAAELRVKGRALVGIGDGPVTRSFAPTALVSRLARVCAEVLALVPTDRVLLEGGATAGAVIHRLAWKRLAACQVAAPGVGALRPVGEERPLVLIKPGSYDWPAEIWG